MPSKRKNIVLGTAYGIKEFPVSEKKHENGLEVEFKDVRLDLNDLKILIASLEKKENSSESLLDNYANHVNAQATRNESAGSFDLSEWPDKKGIQVFIDEIEQDDLAEYESVEEFIDENFYDLVDRYGFELAFQEWDSGAPGAGTGVVSLRQLWGRLFLFHDAGYTEYKTAYDAWDEIRKITTATTYLSISKELRDMVKQTIRR
ncbi:hypothetical protein SDC9_50232 [bioreactor metagenome]|uniref:Uncharacterized protein n=1 Tax=bioreactor metagenome TaxID=1076179 RepID=A0A644WJA1_9ZZZZ|nr:hypothetical protein [Aminivibrio sp.]MEA4952100.1 hypothetical protein [Aminivibrio sp.]